MTKLDKKLLDSNILIIDDDISISNIIKDSLLNDGFKHLMTLQNGKDGIKNLGIFKPDLIILDMQMPIMSGIEFLENLKLENKDNLSIIVLTGKVEDTSIEKAFQLGINAYLRKPFNLFALKGIVKQTLTLKHIQNELKKQLDIKNKLTSKLQEDKLHFMGLVQDKLTEHEKNTFMKELFNFIEND